MVLLIHSRKVEELKSGDSWYSPKTADLGCEFRNNDTLSEIGRKAQDPVCFIIF
jgi:hypothetical protein